MATGPGSPAAALWIVALHWRARGLCFLLISYVRLVPLVSFGVHRGYGEFARETPPAAGG